MVGQYPIQPYTEMQQAQYDAIKKAKSYYEQTNISSTDPVPPVYEVEAYQNMNLVLDSIE